VPTFLQPHTQHFSLHNYFGTRPFSALARALHVMRRAAFADRRACTRVLSSATVARRAGVAKGTAAVPRAQAFRLCESETAATQIALRAVGEAVSA